MNGELLRISSRLQRKVTISPSKLEIKCKVTVKVPNAPQVNEPYRALVEPKEEEILGFFILVNDSENTDQNFSINQRSTRLRKQPSKPNETTAKSKDIRTFFSKERNVVGRACTEIKIVVIDNF